MSVQKYICGLSNQVFLTQLKSHSKCHRDCRVCAHLFQEIQLHPQWKVLYEEKLWLLRQVCEDKLRIQS